MKRRAPQALALGQLAPPIEPRLRLRARVRDKVLSRRLGLTRAVSITRGVSITRVARIVRRTGPTRSTTSGRIMRRMLLERRARRTVLVRLAGFPAAARAGLRLASS